MEFDTTFTFLEYFLAFAAIGLALTYAIYIRYWRASFGGKLPVKFIGLYHSNEVDGTSSVRKREYMKKSNAFIIAIWVCSILFTGILFFYHG